MAGAEGARDATGRRERMGVLAGVAAYGLWGLFPAYWPLLKSFETVEIVAHRIVWSFLVVAILLGIRRGWAWVPRLLGRPRALAAMIAGGLVLSLNWALYIWGVNNGHVLETSLGYFINPLLSVLLGVIVLRERLGGLRWAAVAIAAVGVIWLTLVAGQPPWIALGLALSFAFYGLMKKLARADALESVAVESGAMLLPALAILAALGAQGRAAFGLNHGTDAVMMAAGPITIIPLLLFGAAAIRVPLNVLGLLQYVAPTLQFLLGVFGFHERLTGTQLGGYVAIWIALMVFAASLQRSPAPLPMIPPDD